MTPTEKAIHRANRLTFAAYRLMDFAKRAVGRDEAAKAIRLLGNATRLKLMAAEQLRLAAIQPRAA